MLHIGSVPTVLAVSRGGISPSLGGCYFFVEFVIASFYSFLVCNLLESILLMESNFGEILHKMTVVMAKVAFEQYLFLV